MMNVSRCLLLALVVAILAWMGAMAQTVSTIASSNVTSWAAQLYGSYAGLATNESYELKFYYGLTDGGTNAGAWAQSGGGVMLTPATTNNSGTYSRTVIELAGTNTYYFRAMADGAIDVWATQSMSFVTASGAPTSTPEALYFAVTVDTNGVLREPADFFLKNGIVPTSGVDQIFIRLGSNEVAITALASGKLGVSDASTIYFTKAGGSITGEVTVTTNVSVHGDLSVSKVVSAHTGMFSRIRSPNFGPLKIQAGGETGSGHAGEDLWLLAGDDGVGGYGTIYVGDIGGGSSPSIVNVTGKKVHITNGVYRGIGLMDSVRSGNDTTSITMTNVGASSYINYSGFGNLVIMYSGQTQMVFTGSAVLLADHVSIQANHVSATNGHSFFRSLSGDANGSGGPITNIGLSGLRLANAYTGGVMRLATTDGTTFFLQ